MTGKADDHRAAVRELSQSGREGAALAPTLQRLLKLKTRSQYQRDSVAAHDAASAVVWAGRLYDAAQAVVSS